MGGMDASPAQAAELHPKSLHSQLRYKRLEHGVFLWPSNVDPGGTLMLNSAQLSMLIDGVDWRAPERQWRPAVAG